MTNFRSPRVQRSFRLGYDDQLYGGIAGVSDAAAVTLATQSVLADRAHSSFVLNELNITPRNNSRVYVRQNDGSVTKTLIETEREIALENLQLVTRNYTGIDAIGASTIADGAGNRALVAASGHEMHHSGQSPQVLPVPTVSNGGILDWGGYPHNLETGDLIRIVSNTSTPSINGIQMFTKATATTGSVPVTTTVSVSDGYFFEDAVWSREGRFTASTAHPGATSGTTYRTIWRVRPGTAVRIDFLHAIAASSNDCKIWLAKDSVGTGAVEVARSTAGRAIFEDRILTVTGSTSGGTLGTYILLSTTGASVTAIATLGGARLKNVDRTIYSDFAAPSSAGSGALGYATLRTIPAGTRLVVKRINIDDAAADRVSVGVSTSTGGANYIPYVTTSTGPKSFKSDLVIYDASNTLYLLAVASKAAAGAGVAVANCDSWIAQR